MSEEIKARVLAFLYKQVQEGKIPQIRKGMVEEFEGFVSSEITLIESKQMANRMAATAAQAEESKEKKTDEKDTKR